MSTVQTQINVPDPYTALFNYMDKIVEKVKPELEKMFENYDIWTKWREKGDILEYEIIVEVDVTKLLGLEKECLWFEGVEWNCGNALSEEEECDEDSPSYDEKKCEEKFRECFEEEVRQFKEENCGLPFHFGYSNPPMVVAYLATLEDEDAYRLCCGVKLVLHYKNSVYKDVVGAIANSDSVAEYSASRLLSEFKKVVEAVKALAP